VDGKPFVAGIFGERGGLEEDFAGQFLFEPAELAENSFDGRIQKSFRVAGFLIGHFNAQQGGRGIATEPAGGHFVGNKGVKAGGFQSCAVSSASPRLKLVTT